MTPPTIRQSIADAMTRIGITQAELSRRCGGAPSQAKISQFLAGRDLSVANLQRILDALDLRITRQVARK